MSSSPQPQVSLKLVIDKKHKKIIFCEAEKNFIDFLFTILALPVGTVVSLLSAEGMVGPLGNIWRSVESLNIDCFQTKHSKDGLLNPKVSVPNSEGLQLLQIEYTSASKIYYSCIRRTCRYNFTTTHGTICPSCYKEMHTLATYIESDDEKKEASSNEAYGYVKGIIKYIVMDDLTVKPISSISSFSILRELEVNDLELIEEKVINFDMAEGLKLLRASLDSTTVLNDVFLHKIDFS